MKIVKLYEKLQKLFDKEDFSKRKNCEKLKKIVKELKDKLKKIKNSNRKKEFRQAEIIEKEISIAKKIIKKEC